MSIVNIINDKIISLQNDKEASKGLSDDIYLLNKYIELLNKLDKDVLDLDAYELMGVLFKYGSHVENPSELIKNVKNLVEYYVVYKKEVLKLPGVYENGLKKLKDELMHIKDEITQRLTLYSKVDKRISDLEKVVAFLNNAEGSQLTAETLETLYESVLKNVDFNVALPIYKELFMHDEKKTEIISNDDKKTDITMKFESAKERKEVSIDEVKSLLGEYFKVEKFEKELSTYEKEIITSIDIDEARRIIEFFKEKRLLKIFETERKALLKLIVCGNYKDIETMYSKIKERTDTYGISIKEFLTSASVSVWINLDESIKEPSKRGRKGYNSVPNGLHANYITFDDVRENISLLEMNNDILREKNSGAYYTSVLVKSVNPIILSRNLTMCRMFGMTNVSLSALNEDLEVKLHKVVELGLLNPPLNNERFELEKRIETEYDYAGASKYDISIRNYFNRYSSILVDLSSKKLTYLFAKLSGDKTEFYKDFFTTSNKKNGSRQLLSKSELDNLKDPDYIKKISEKFIVNEDVIPSYSTYDADIAEYEKKDRDLMSKYYDENILEDDYIKMLEEDNSVYDDYCIVQNGKSRPVVEKNKYTYGFYGKNISRLKVLRNASILKYKYGVLTPDMVLASIARNSYITSEEFESIKYSIMRRSK